MRFPHPAWLCLSVAACAARPSPPSSHGSGGRDPRCDVGTPVRATDRPPLAVAPPSRFVAAVPDVGFPRCPRFDPMAPAERFRLRLQAHSHPAPSEGWARMLSGLTWDPRTGRFFAVQDNDPHLVELRPAADSSAWSGAFLPADFGPHAGIEAVTRLGTSWLLADDGDGSPEVAHVFSLDASGRLGPAPFSLPALMQARSHNSGFEALGVSPDGGTVLLGQERPPFVRGHCLDNPLLLRVRLSDQHQEYFSYPLERDGGGADVGLSELAALSPSRALTLERGFTRGVGSGGRLFLSELGEGGTGEAPGALRKSLLVDLQQLPRERFDFPLPAGQTLHPAMGNYEGMTLGPCLDSGERSLVLLTDDNADSDPTHGGQPRHLLVLSLATEP